jgi:hypothetical protein
MLSRALIRARNHLTYNPFMAARRSAMTVTYVKDSINALFQEAR